MPFCPACQAPQIRVAGGTIDISAATAYPPGTPENMQPPARPVILRGPAVGAIDWRAGLPAAVQAGLVAGILSALPLISLLFVIWMLLGGFLAVTFYRRRRAVAPLTTGLGARLGVVASLFGFGFFVATTAGEVAIQTLVLHHPNVLREQIMQAIQQSAARATDPETQRMLESLQTPGGIAAFFALALILFFVGFFVLGTIGGAVGGAMGRRNEAR